MPIIEPLGEIIAASTCEITGQCRREGPPFVFGSIVASGRSLHRCVGVVYNVETTSIDPNRRSIALDKTEEEIERFYPQLKALLRIQFQALLIGSLENGAFRYGLPAAPPALHAQAAPCSEDELDAISNQPDFIRLLFDSGKSSAEELILSCCRHLLDALQWRDELVVRTGKALSDLYRDDYETLRRLINRLESWRTQ
ncbi:MAG: hypothetical protein JXR73_05260 [Candidatus Omnitrophica bacterium]|nr:hypothetical protein [Candidatus Omnitrophota bacterium]